MSKPPVAKTTLPAVGSEERSSVPDHPASIATFVDAIIAQGPPINLEKITRVRAEIARGTFAADPVGIADAMLNLRVRGQ